MGVPLHNYGFLLGAIVLETLATSCLKQTEGFSRLVPTVLTLAAYGGSFFFLSLTLRVIPLGIAYATWCGLGIVLISAVGLVVYHQSLDLAAYIGLGLIMAGVVVVNVFSKSAGH